MPDLTLLVTGDPSAVYLKPLDRIGSAARIVISEDRGRVMSVAPQADVLLNGDFRDPTMFLAAFPHATRVKWIHSPGAGVERVLSPEIIASPVPLTNSAGVFATALGEWVIGAMIYFCYDLPRVLRNQAARRWEPFQHPELYRQTLAIVGYGGIGRAIAERARAFGMRILTLGRKDMAKLTEALAEADYVAVSAPLTAETRGMIGAAQIAAMKTSAVLINVGRGAIVDEPALLDALASKRLRGAALDVFLTEPLPPDHPFYNLENVLISPHCADDLPDSRERAIDFFVDNFERFRKGESLQNVVNKHAGY